MARVLNDSEVLKVEKKQRPNRGPASDLGLLGMAAIFYALASTGISFAVDWVYGHECLFQGDYSQQAGLALRPRSSRW